MAIQYVDPGGEYYYSLAVPTAPGQWSGSTQFVGLVNNAPAGASTTYAIVLPSNGAVFKNLAASYAGGTLGRRCYVSGNFSAGAALFQLFDGANTQIEIRTDAVGHLYATRNGVQIGSTSTFQLTASQGWTYFDLTAVISTTVGSVSLYVNNVQWLNVTGVNTQNTANATFNRIQLENPFSSPSYEKDIYFLDNGTGVNTTRLGDITVGILWPNAAGVNQAWTNNGGSSQTNSVQDGISQTGTWPDGDATYISSSTTNQISDFAHQSLTLTGSLFGVVHAMYTRKDDAGSRQIAGVCLSGSATAVGTTQSLGNSYQYFFDVLEDDPNTSAAWVVTGLNSATFGVKELT
jgi:hypothetical protein